MRKYGLLVYHDTENIGDDIQAYAAMQYLPHVDYYIDREELNRFHPHEDYPVAVIMNAWYMHRKFNWPPSAFIDPLYISVHFNEEDTYSFHIDDHYLDGFGGDHLRQNGPIGCRDKATLQLLQQKEIPAYFSGCMTLTLPQKFKKESVSPYACLTNVPDSVKEYLQKKYPDIRFIDVSHEPAVPAGLSWTERFHNVEELLTLYQNASFVVTTKLHCALPCLALETPVLFLQEEEIVEQNRFAGLAELLYTTSSENVINGHCGFSFDAPPANKPLYCAV